MKRRILAILLTICMVATLLPTAFAAEADTALPAADENGVITLNNDVTLDHQLAIQADTATVIDLNGHTLKISGTDTNNKVRVLVNGTLTVKDSSEDKTGVLCADYAGTSGNVVRVEENGKLVVSGGTITSEYFANNGNAVNVARGAAVEMTGGTIKCTAKRNNVAVNVIGSFAMTGGSVIAEMGDGSETSITAISGPGSSSKITISGESVVSGPQAIYASNAQVSITDGRFTGTIRVKLGSIAGGAFDREVPLASCASGYIPTQNADGTYGVTGGDYVAMVGETTYNALQTAVDAAANGSTIVMIGNTALTKPVVVSDKTLTLNLNGWTINNESDIWDVEPGAWSLISVRGSGNLTITGSGTLSARENDCYAVDVQDKNAQLTIEGGTYLGNIHAVYVESGSALIKGGTYSVQQKFPTAGKENEFVLNLYDAHREDGTAKLSVTGGTFYEFNPYDCKAEGEGTNFCAAGYCTSKYTSKGSTKYTVQVASVEVISGDKHDYYSNLSAAISAAKDGDTVKLLKDGTASSLKAGVAYDLNGHKLTYSGNGFAYEKQTTSFIDSSVSGIERGGTLSMTGAKAGYAGITVGTGATLNVSNISVTTTKGECFFPKGDAAQVNVTNCDMSANWYCIGTNAATTDNYNVEINLKGSTFVSRDASDGTPVYINVKGTLNIDDCELTSNRQAVMVRAGTANITNSTLKTNGNYTNKTQYYTSAWSSGNEVPAAALTVGNYQAGAASAYLAPAAVTIENSTLIGGNGFPAVYVDGNTTYAGSVTIGGENTYVSGAMLKGQQTAEGKVSIAVTGGYFTSDPSAYCDADHTGVASNDATYPYTVGEKNAEAKPAHVDSATVPAGTAQNASQQVQEVAQKMSAGAALSNNAASEAAAKDLANNNKTTGATAVEGTTTVMDKVNETLDEGSKLTDPDDVAIVYQTYIDVTVADAKQVSGDTITEITVDMTPMYRVVATTKTVVEGNTEIKADGDDKNAVVIEAGKKLTVPTGKYEVKLAIPSALAKENDKLAIKHTKDNGTVEFYTGTVTKEGEQLYVTFTTNGFSPFTIYAADANVAQIGEDVYISLDDAIKAVPNGGTIKLLKDNLSGTVSRAVSFTLTAASSDLLEHVKLTAGAGYSLKKEENTYTATYVGYGTTPAQGLPFTDVSKDSPYYDGIKFVYEKGIMKGVTPTTFEPGTAVTRGMLVTLLYRCEGSPAVTGASFTDVAAGRYFTDAVAWAAKNGIVTGFSDGTFRPDAPVSRQQLAVILFRYAGYKGMTAVTLEENLNGFTDESAISGYAISAMNWAVGQGLVNGFSDGSVRPTEGASRAQTATVLMRLLQNVLG